MRRRSTTTTASERRQASTRIAVSRWAWKWHEESGHRNPKVLGLDPSSTRTGYACMLDPSRVAEVGFLRPSGTSLTDWARSMGEDLHQMIAELRPDVILIEGPSGKMAGRIPGRSSGLSIYGFVVGVFAGAACARAENDYELFVIDEPLWTMSLPKIDRRLNVELLLPEYRNIRASDRGMDIADALGLCLWFYRQFGASSSMSDQDAVDNVEERIRGPPVCQSCLYALATAYLIGRGWLFATAPPAPLLIGTRNCMQGVSVMGVGRGKSKPRRHYLAIVRTNLDELPLLLTTDKNKAESAARRCGERDQKRAAALMGVDLAEPVTGAIVTFEDGIPTDL